MLRRLIRWLLSEAFRKEFLDGVRHGEVGAASRERCAQMEGELKAQLSHQRGRLEGYVEGRQAAFDAVSDCLVERGGSVVTEEDVEMAKKRSTH